ncbi:DEAD/DEAH box helicase family protein [Glycomyces sp. TRM65418]|uniref:DEAD/DEAH box helicase n=1 Tax=Glycomyces sp. TRM65418 TaxID=2867006 RepID=UPI001CE4CC01|nr:DEAD/DEAH box helicase family protein [Glycomyces sp. TRM65418]MCC3762564.1 DEAD/DEAH box helicase family protein [Glycomyces sp. TRM65418]QZD56603.1 DEAD/DEAH box helicase family protein [Glycomyces sp. TRM65418]
MGELQFQADLLNEVAHRLDLRAPNREAVRSVLLRTSDHYDVQENTEPYECIVDSATGVGKTFVMAGLMEYLAGAEAPARNFLLLAPGRTIRDKSIANFSAGTRKSLRHMLRSNPVVVTAENFDSQATRIAMDDPSVTKLYIFTVQALTSATGEGRATHEALETLGDSFFNRLAKLDDLVILADEHHCYRGKAFSRTIQQLRPELVVGLTATPARSDESMVAFRYPLAAAIADQLVKTPVMVGRRDDRTDIETKLLDGVNLLRYKAQHADAYCDEHGLAKVNPVMLVIAGSIEEAKEFQEVLDSASFDGGSWVGKTLLVHSKLPSEEKEQALADLAAVEDPDSPVRIIISVGMLKEGWDVKNVYVIASMRASVSEVMTEQTLGRGMRLPFGRYTGVEILDTLEVLAHEKYSELLAKRKVLNEAFINYGIYAEIRQLQDGRSVVRDKAFEAETDVIAAPSALASDETSRVGGSDLDGGQPASESGSSLEADSRPAFIGGVVDIDTRTQVAAESARKTTAKIAYAPLPERESIIIPLLEAVPQPVVVSLNQIHDYTPFEQLGRALTNDISDELRRTKITATHDGRKVEVTTETANDTIASALPLEMPLETLHHQLMRRAMAVKGVANRPNELGAAKRIVDSLIDAMGDKAAAHLSAFGERCGQRLAAKITEALKDTTQAQFTYSDEAKPVFLDKTREANKRQVDGHADGSFDKAVAFGGWSKNLYSHAWFDSAPEFSVANAIDDDPDVIVWARLHVNDVPIKWTSEGREYNPDLVVIEEIDGKRVGWLVEIKADKDLNSAEVLAKRNAAKRWANTANSLEGTDATWRYLLIGEQDIEDAQGLWSQLKEFGQ